MNIFIFYILGKINLFYKKLAADVEYGEKKHNEMLMILYLASKWLQMVFQMQFFS